MFTQEITGYHKGEELQVVMSYDENDPLAVTFAIPEGTTFVEWKFARDLIVEALGEGNSGIGDVQIGVTDNSFMVSLTGRDGNMIIIIFPVDEVEIFLEQTEVMVPFGDESKFFDIDDEWEALAREYDS